MLTGVCISVAPSDRARLIEIATDRNSPQKHVWRAQIVLLSADDVSTHGITRATGTSKTCVWRWQRRFMEAGRDGLLTDKTRPRIASSEMLPDTDPLPRLKCSRPGIGEGGHEADQHGNT